MVTAIAPFEDAKCVTVGGLWIRLGAGVVDALLLTPVLSLVLLLALWAADSSVSLLRVGPEVLLDLALSGRPLVYGLAFLAVLAIVSFKTLFIGNIAATPGQKLLGLRVIDYYGDNPSLGQALLRAVGVVLSAGLWGLGVLWIAFDREKRSLHDWLAGTYVITTKGSDT